MEDVWIYRYRRFAQTRKCEAALSFWPLPLVSYFLLPVSAFLVARALRDLRGCYVAAFVLVLGQGYGSGSGR